MLYSEIIAVCSQIYTKHINATLWAERRISERQTCRYIQETLRFKMLIKLGSQDLCCVTNIISYILLELRRRSIYFKFAVNSLMFAERIIILVLNIFLCTN